MSEVKATLKVAGWGCEGCAGATTDALKKVTGVRSVTTDLERGIAGVVYDDANASRADLVKAVSDAGYQVVG
ncbi:MAG: heavy-metal-associated domain-containing protein [Myxococcales bacterium]